MAEADGRRGVSNGWTSWSREDEWQATGRESRWLMGLREGRMVGKY